MQRKKIALISSWARRSDRMPSAMARGSDVVMVTRLSRMWSWFAQQRLMDQPSSGHAGGSCCRASRCAAHNVACHRRPRCHSCGVHRLRIGGAQEGIVRVHSASPGLRKSGFESNLSKLAEMGENRVYDRSAASCAGARARRRAPGSAFSLANHAAFTPPSLSFTSAVVAT